MSLRPFQAAKLGSLKGLWHAAGLLDDHLLADLEREHLHLGRISSYFIHVHHLSMSLVIS